MLLVGRESHVGHAEGCPSFENRVLSGNSPQSRQLVFPKSIAILLYNCVTILVVTCLIEISDGLPLKNLGCYHWYWANNWISDFYDPSSTHWMKCMESRTMGLLQDSFMSTYRMKITWLIDLWLFDCIQLFSLILECPLGSITIFCSTDNSFIE